MRIRQQRIDGMKTEMKTEGLFKIIANLTVITTVVSAFFLS